MVLMPWRGRHGRLLAMCVALAGVSDSTAPEEPAGPHSVRVRSVLFPLVSGSGCPSGHTHCRQVPHCDFAPGLLRSGPVTDRRGPSAGGHHSRVPPRRRRCPAEGRSPLQHERVPGFHGTSLLDGLKHLQRASSARVVFGGRDVRPARGWLPGGGSSGAAAWPLGTRARRSPPPEGSSRQNGVPSVRPSRRGGDGWFGCSLRLGTLTDSCRPNGSPPRSLKVSTMKSFLESFFFWTLKT